MYLESEPIFKQFYIDHYSSVRIYIFAKSGDMTLSEDLAQESFIRLWKNREKIQKDKAKSFVFTVASNLYLDHIRHQKVKNNYKNSFSFMSETNDPQFLIEMEEFRKKLDQTILSMPETSREVFLLNRIEKMTYVQIADSLGLSVKAIEKRMQKALEIMSALRLSQ